MCLRRNASTTRVSLPLDVDLCNNIVILISLFCDWSSQTYKRIRTMYIVAVDDVLFLFIFVFCLFLLWKLQLSVCEYYLENSWSTGHDVVTITYL